MARLVGRGKVDGGSFVWYEIFRIRIKLPPSTFWLTIVGYLYKLCLMVSVDAAFAALADPTRRAILLRLADGEATVMELAEPFAMTQPAISQHLKVLENAGLIVRRVEGTKRPSRLAKGGIAELEQWLGALRKALEQNYDRLDDVLEKGKKKR